MTHPIVTQPAAVRVLIVEDDPLVEAGERLTLSGSGFDVIGVAHDLDEGVALALAERPDVVVADVMLQEDAARPGPDGPASRWLHRQPRSSAPVRSGSAVLHRQGAE